jgi:hypothetical protein
MKAFMGIASLVTAGAAGAAAAIARRPQQVQPPIPGTHPDSSQVVQAIDAARDRLRAGAAGAPGARAA